MYTPIDISNWNRRELFQHFSQMKMPHFIAAANVDVTRLLAYKRANGLSFYLSLIYLSTEVLNSIDNFHLRFEQGQVVSYDRIHTNSPISGLVRTSFAIIRHPSKAPCRSTSLPHRRPSSVRPPSLEGLEPSQMWLISRASLCLMPR